MILAAGLSPAWQQILRFDALHVGEVNRATEALWCASGKVVNVAVGAASLGHETTLISAIGGISGDVIQREVEYLEVRADWIFTSAATRVCTTILDATGKTTELVENMADLELHAIADFIDRTTVYANVSEVTVLTGSLPANAPVDVFARIMRNTQRRFLLDLRGEPLKHCLNLNPFLIKPNREELQATVGRSLAADEDLLKAMRDYNDWGVRWVVVSDGAKGVWVTSDDIAVKFIPPSIEVVNPIGCGDALASGIACKLEYNDDVLAAVRFGMGAAAHNAEQLLPARLDPRRCDELAGLVKMQELH
ncbi:1-phosphofructokinase family hexose kinase [Planctomicrobium sp. SH661]|uniref:1-phosphofructokinase family hexose kinase n=1 Tax=Planctomicrobium sp. SH661 TaxID=3448124 RepID=UPI003F5C950F